LGEESTLSITLYESPIIDPISDQSACFIYVLPEITGNNVSDNRAFYTESGGQGTKYLSGDTIRSDVTLYMFDGASNCNAEEQFKIDILSTEIDLGDDIFICSGESYEFSLSGYNSYTWNGVEGSAQFSVSESGEVYVEVIGENSCKSSDTVQLNVMSTPVLNLGNDTSICTADGYELYAGEFSVYERSSGENTARITIYPGEQTISLRVENSDGCEAIDEINILGCEEDILGDITNVFTPNGDFVHDTWVINKLEQFQSAKIEVFDRWGRRVFYLEKGYSENAAWDGTFNGKELPMDNYYYIIDLYGDGSKLIKGNVAIVK
jgi:gliding motility-associated-like protein